jgi:hypothetical protein
VDAITDYVEKETDYFYATVELGNGLVLTKDEDYQKIIFYHYAEDGNPRPLLDKLIDAMWVLEGVRVDYTKMCDKWDSATKEEREHYKKEGEWPS